MGELNVLDRDELLRRIARQEARIDKIMAMLQGQPIQTVRIASLSASKLTAGTITVLVGIGDEERMEMDGPNNRFLIYDVEGDDRILIGKRPV